jgi:hypothetical protein
MGEIRGRVQAPDGSSTAGLPVFVTPIGENGASPSRRRVSVVNGDSSFRLLNLPPGGYAVEVLAYGMAATTSAEQRVRSANASPFATAWARDTVQVFERSATDVALSLRDTYAVSGEVDFLDAPSPKQISGVLVTLDEVDKPKWTSPPHRASTSETGEFRIDGVPPGDYRIRAERADLAKDGWSVSNVWSAGQDILDANIRLEQDRAVSSAIRITLSRHFGQLSGAILRADGQAGPYAVVIFPAERNLWGGALRRHLYSKAATDGHYSIERIPPGLYRVAAVTGFDPAMLSIPDAIRRLDSVAVTIDLRNAGGVVLNLMATR